MNPASPSLERRIIPAKISYRDAGDASPGVIYGVSAVTETWADIGGYFREKIARGAFANAIAEKQDVRCLYDHLTHLVLGRTAANTCKIWESDKGLEFECSLPDTTFARDLAISIARGDVTQCSFAFTVRDGGAVWTNVESDDGPSQWERVITDVDLYDVGPVTYPAYVETSVALRSLEQAKRRVKRRDAKRAMWLDLALLD